jgi:pre-rRNA-processing protein IPI3
MQIGGSHTASSGSQGSKRGPKRPQPLAPFCKYPNAPGTLKPWEGGLVLLDGSAGVGLGLGAADWQHQHIEQQLGVAAIAGSGAGAAPGGAAAVPAGAAAEAAGTGPGDAPGVEALREENQRLREQLERAVQTAQQWGRLNTQLQELCAEGLLANGH